MVSSLHVSASLGDLRQLIHDFPVYFADDYVGGRKCRLLSDVNHVFDHVRSALHKGIRSAVETEQTADGIRFGQTDGRLNTIRQNQKITVGI